MKDLYVSWDEYNRLIEKLALKVWESGWNFDAIVCLARGGLRIGDVFSRLFDKPLGVLFTSSYREEAGTKRSRLMIAEHMSSAAPLPGPRWLLVDDLVDSGATLVEVLPALKSRYPQVEEIRSAVVWAKGSSVAMPDYCIEHLPSNPWIHQPFEEYDHMRPNDLKARWG
ncbi:phosphoribosyltransferase [Burkholderiaceae bacterium FT117]|uniref:phosphoribosyltransferase n=1 Tax=Zeimonas sediminis TaxID=2944268 RepID=UPI002342FF6A|nr:phosphoribosyltransferase family protein [Zeimonas sediminis]MCM5571922.1 phosphoribosyltransferase [Zeimonas sediminis]